MLQLAPTVLTPVHGVRSGQTDDHLSHHIYLEQNKPTLAKRTSYQHLFTTSHHMWNITSENKQKQKSLKKKPKHPSPGHHNKLTVCKKEIRRKKRIQTSYTLFSKTKQNILVIVQVDEESLRLGAGARESPILVVDRNGGSQVRGGEVLIINIETR